MTMGPEPMTRILRRSSRRGIGLLLGGATHAALVVHLRTRQEIRDQLLDGLLGAAAAHVPARVGEAFDDAPLDAPRLFLLVRQKVEQGLLRRLGLLVQDALDGREADALVDVLEVRDERGTRPGIVELA